MDALDAGHSVVVAAPTGSGKTVVAEYAVAKALAAGKRAFYTTPIKALSNQKYLDLCALHGRARVGLLTGDTSVNDSAPVVVMTTEVLRNMIYAHSRSLDDLRYVVLDEVHFLQDTYRGPVWEEVIIHTPHEVDLVCLSATVSNAAELADWVTTVRGATDVVIHHQRPVELEQLYLVGDRSSAHIDVFDMFTGGRPNPAAIRLDADSMRTGGPRSRDRREASVPRRIDVVDMLQMEQMLPAIYFIFSRAACDEAMRACLYAGMRLTNPEERALIRNIIEPHMEALTDADLDVLDFNMFLSALENGIAAHHAGMVPPFKEAVEACFVEGLVKVVFATETLALGINMPARTVVIEKLSKYTGAGHQMLTPGEYTQLTGRAGRRGIDQHGFAVTMWSPYTPFESVAALASQRTYELRSAFKPTYNMAANLIRRSSREQAHHFLNLSFAQFQADSQLVRSNAQMDRQRRELAEAKALARCGRGDIDEYRQQQHLGQWRAVPVPEQDVADVLERVRPGDVLRYSARGAPEVRESSGRDDGAVAVVSTSSGRRGEHVTLRVLTQSGRSLSLTATDMRGLPEVVGQVKLPTPYNPQSKAFQRDMVAGMQRLLGRSRRRSPLGEESPLFHAVVLTGVAGCVDLAEHVRAASRADRIQRELERTQRMVAERSSSLVNHLDRVLNLLESAGFVDGWSLTVAGTLLCSIFHESDLLIADCIRSGVLDGLTPPQLAALTSVFVFEQRGPGRGPRGGPRDRSVAAELPPGFPRGLVSRWFQVVDRAEAVNGREADADLTLTRMPDPGFAVIAHAWASGKDLERVLVDADITGGDFVRTVKSLVDLLRQIALAAPMADTRAAASSAADNLFRGVVAASSAPTVVPDGPVGANSASE